MAQLVDLAGPIGPMQSLDERFEQKRRWISEVDDTAFDDLLDILVNPPGAEERFYIDADDYEFQLADLLIELGRRDPAGSLAKIAPLIVNRDVRPVVVDVIGGLRAPTGLDLLEQILGRDDLTPDELVRIATALGEIGATRARVLLLKLRERTTNPTPEVQKEIEIALRAIDQ